MKQIYEDLSDDTDFDIIDLDDIQRVFEERLYAKDGKVLIKCD